VPEQSHRDEMSAAIRAQRERHAVPRSMVPADRPVPPPEPPEPLPPEPRKRLFAGLRRK
jgi:hypothetical protein